MKFSCGETNRTKAARLSQWHQFFVLWPRTLGIENGRFVCVWLQTVQRRGTFVDGGYFESDSWDWEYKLNDADELV